MGSIGDGQEVDIEDTWESAWILLEVKGDEMISANGFDAIVLHLQKQEKSD